ncbi:MAG: hypothetical protein MUE90_14120 [Thermoanaerobaculales bacterium]|jgi:hypothetical protein|nr:hypothetical protein [Thermoanaerobaculales bacterium]
MRAARIFAVVVVGAIWALPGAAQPAPVSGQLTVDGETIAPVNAVAVWTTNGDERHLQVVMAPGAVDAGGTERSLDPASAIRQSIDGDSITLTLARDGSLVMVFAFLEDGSRNYGLGSGGVAEVAIGDGRIAGRVFTEGETSIGDTPIAFDLRLDLPILPERAPGEPLPAGGGEAGAAYVALTAAKRSGDAAVLARHLPASDLGLVEPDGSFPDWLLDSMREMAPQDMTVRGGELFDGWAILEVAGRDSSGGAVEGRVLMERDGDTWRFLQEDLRMVW